MEAHGERIERQRRAYRAAHDRLVARLRGADAGALVRAPDEGGWCALQIGWHVAAVDRRVAAVIAGDAPAAVPVTLEMAVRRWPEIVASLPPRIEAGAAVAPPPTVIAGEVFNGLTDAARRLDAALAGLTEPRGVGFALPHPALGLIALADLGEFVTAHTIRHNAQAKRTLGA